MIIGNILMTNIKLVDVENLNVQMDAPERKIDLRLRL